MKKRIARSPIVWVGVLGLLSLVMAACASPATQPPAPAATSAPAATLKSPTAAPAASPTAQASSEATINLAEDPKLGKILVDGNGMTLYMFTKDEADKTNCTDKCLENWPALVTAGQPQSGRWRGCVHDRHGSLSGWLYDRDLQPHAALPVGQG